MDMFNPMDLRARIEKKRAEFPFLPAYMGPYGLWKSCQRNKEALANDPSFRAFAEDLGEYLRFGFDFVREEAEAKDKEQAEFVGVFCIDAFKDASFEDNEALLEALLSYYGDGEGFIPDYEMKLLLGIILGYMRGNHPWRGRKYAKRLENAILNEFAPKEVFQGLSSFYRTVLDHVSANRVALDGATQLRFMGKKEDAARLCKDALGSALWIPDYAFPSEEEIKSLYGEEGAKIVMGYLRPTFKHDPIESSKEFQDVYDEVMEEAMAKYLGEGEGRVVLSLWSYMREGFLKRGIDWQTPIKMNPGARFD